MHKQRSHTFLRVSKSAALMVAVLFAPMAWTESARATGELDLTFGFRGVASTDFFGKADIAYDMLVQPDGKIVVIGMVHTDFTDWYDFALARYNTDGTLDNTFGNGGKVFTNFNVDDKAYAAALQPDGKIVVVGSTVAVWGSSQVDFAVARYNSNGTLDSTFGSGGKTTVDFETIDDFARAVVVQSDGKILVGGTVRVVHPTGHDTDFGLARLNSNGTLDTTFDGDGKVNTTFPNGGGFVNDELTSMLLYADGRILTGGSSSGFSSFAAALFNPNGSLDTSFDSDGKLLLEFPAIKGMVLQPDGKIVAGGNYIPIGGSTLGFAVNRINPDGSLDTTFNGDGRVMTPPRNWSEIAADVALTPDGKIVMVGSNDTGQFVISRYLANGDPDLNFGSRGKFFTYMGLGPPRAYAAAIQADGKLLVAGQRTYNSPEFSNFEIVRHTANPTSVPVRSDFDGDGRSDVSVFRPSDGTWYVLRSSDGGFQAQPFGTNGDIAAPGDYDGDGGMTDYAVFRPSNGAWYFLNSSDGSFRSVLFGATGDIPVPADYDGDSKTDIALYRPSEGVWYILRSSDNGFQAEHFGVSTDRPVPGYYDTDNKVDIAVFRESEAKWYQLHSSNNSLVVWSWGVAGDQPAAADYDGDGKFDLAVFRPSEGRWYLLPTSMGTPTYIRWGTAGDIVAPGDYNGDFRAEVALWRPSNGGWYMLSGQTYAFGASGDTPTLNAYYP